MAGLQPTRRWLWAIGVVIGLSILTVVWLRSKQPAYTLNVISLPTGWGYEVTADGKSLIYQPNRPGIGGDQGFASEEQARRVGELVVTKLRRGQFPPTVSRVEMQELGVPVP